MKLRVIKPKTNKGIETKMSSEKIYPSFSIALEHLPEAKEWDIKEHYMIQMEVEMVGLHMDEGFEDARFKIKKIGVLPNPKKSHNSKVDKRYD